MLLCDQLTGRVKWLPQPIFTHCRVLKRETSHTPLECGWLDVIHWEWLWSATIPQTKKQKPLPRGVLHHSLKLACSQLTQGRFPLKPWEELAKLGNECEVLALWIEGLRNMGEDHESFTFPIVRHCSETPTHETVPEPSPCGMAR